MTSRTRIPQLAAAIGGAVALSAVGALAHRHEAVVNLTSTAQLHIVFGIILAVTVLAAWTRIIHLRWGAPASATFFMSWTVCTLLIASSHDDILIAADSLGYAYLISGGTAGVLALAWPSKETRVLLRQLRKGRSD